MNARITGAVWVLATLLTPGPPPAAVESGVCTSGCTAAAGAVRIVDISIDMGGGGASLGSYGGSITWDPAVLEYQGWVGGDPPFNSPVVNTANAAAGWLTYADATPAGAEGLVRVLSVSLLAIQDPPAQSQLDLEFSSVFGGEDIEDLMPELEVEDGTACVTDFDFELRARGGPNTLLDWNTIPAAARYDVIRGDLSLLFGDVASVHLGVVNCLENDSLDTTTGAGSELSNPDVDTPAVGEGFFYVVRFHDGAEDRTYGFLVDCERERIVDAGDCP